MALTATAACGDGSFAGDTSLVDGERFEGSFDGQRMQGESIGGGAEEGAQGEVGSSEPIGARPRLARLTRQEYAQTLRQALEVEADLASLPEDARVGTFTSNARSSSDPIHPYLLAAEEIAQTLIPQTVEACEAGAANCFEDTYRPIIEGLFRRQLTDADVRSWRQLLSNAEEAGASSVEASQALLTAALVSPDFLYRSVPWSGGEEARVERTAEWLSYALWDAPPDLDLQSAVEQAEVSGELESLAMSMLEEPRAIRVMARFLSQWLQVDTDMRGEEPGFEDSGSFLELLSFVEDAVYEQLPVTELLSGTRGFVHADNAPVYGMDADGMEESVLAVDWPEESPRRGLLAQELFAGATRHPDASRRKIFRGKLVRRALLCSEIPAPTPELIALAGEVSDRTTDARCQGCHQRMDPIGQAFYAFDADMSEPSQPAEVLHHDELEGTYSDVGELLQAVSSSRTFAECFARHWLSFFLEQGLKEVDPTASETLADLVESGASLSTLVGETLGQVAEAPLLMCAVEEW